MYKTLTQSPFALYPPFLMANLPTTAFNFLIDKHFQSDILQLQQEFAEIYKVCAAQKDEVLATTSLFVYKHTIQALLLDLVSASCF